MRAVPSEEAEASRLEVGHQVSEMTSAACPASRRTADSGISRGPAGQGRGGGRRQGARRKEAASRAGKEGVVGPAGGSFPQRPGEW